MSRFFLLIYIFTDCRYHNFQKFWNLALIVFLCSPQQRNKRKKYKGHDHVYSAWYVWWEMINKRDINFFEARAETECFFIKLTWNVSYRHALYRLKMSNFYTQYLGFWVIIMNEILIVPLFEIEYRYTQTEKKILIYFSFFCEFSWFSKLFNGHMYQRKYSFTM